MGVSKIDFTFENLHFSCKGDNAWVEKQLNNVLSRIPSLLAVHKKGENIVEEVIEVSEEELLDDVLPADGLEANLDTPVTSGKAIRIPKVKKSKEPKAVKVKIFKEKIAREPKVQKVKKLKVPKIVSGTTNPESGVVGEPLKRGRKPKEDGSHTSKVKQVKKKANLSSQLAEPQDSPLSQFIVEKKGAKNQVRKFLATAVFLSRSNEGSRLSTPIVSKALKSSGIEKLQNASDCLNKNEKKGYCIKEGREFIVTENGFLSIE